MPATTDGVRGLAPAVAFLLAAVAACGSDSAPDGSSGPTQAQAQTPRSVTGCGEVRESIRLTADLASEGTCFEVRENGVTIEGNGHRISSTGHAVSVRERSHVTIRGIVTSARVQFYGAEARSNVLEGSEVGSVAIFMADDSVVRTSSLGSIHLSGLHGDPALRTTIEANTIEGPQERLVYLSPGGTSECVRSDLVVRGNRIRGTVREGANQILLYLRCGSHNQVSENELRSEHAPTGILIRDELDQSSFEGNDVWLESGERAAITVIAGNTDRHHPRQNVFRGNVFRSDRGRSLWIQGADTRNHLFERNLFWSGGGEGTRITGGTDNVFDHNTFVSPSAPGILVVLERFGPPGNRYTNNVFSHGGDMIFRLSGETDLAGYAAEHNVFHNRSGPVRFGDSRYDLGEWQAVTKEDQGSIEADPSFVDPSRGDFRLAPGSPARGAASDGSDAGAF